MKVVIADDEQLIRYELKSMLDELLDDCQIREAANGRELIALCHADTPDIAFVDIKMPGTSGLQALEALCAQPAETGRRKTIYIILSGYGEFEMAQKAIHLGVEEYLLKPAKKSEIVDVLSRVFPEGLLEPTANPAGDDEAGSQIHLDRSLVTVRQAERLIRECFESAVGVSEIAERMGITPNYLSSQFVRWRKKTFTQYVTELRMQKARELLVIPGMRVSQVASRLGYSSAGYFSRLFHEHCGISPSEFLAKNS